MIRLRHALRGSAEPYLWVPGHRGEGEQRKVPAPILHPGHSRGESGLVHGQPPGMGTHTPQTPTSRVFAQRRLSQEQADRHLAQGYFKVVTMEACNCLGTRHMADNKGMTTIPFSQWHCVSSTCQLQNKCLAVHRSFNGFLRYCMRFHHSD